MTDLKILMQNMLKELNEQEKLNTKKPQKTTLIWVGLMIWGIFAGNFYIMACSLIVYARDLILAGAHDLKDTVIVKHILEIGIQLFEYKTADLTAYHKAKEEVNFDIEDKLIDSFDPINLEKMREQKQAEARAKLATAAATYFICNSIANKLVGRKENGLLPW